MLSGITTSRKGEIGYFAHEKRRRLLITIGLFILPVAVLIIGWVINGTRNNVLTVLAIIGSLPGCRSIVGLIMIWRCPAPKMETMQTIAAHAGTLAMAYENCVTTYEKSMVLLAVAFSGNTVVGYTDKKETDTAFFARHCQDFLQKSGFKVDVKILTDLPIFLERLDALSARKAEHDSHTPPMPDDGPTVTRDDTLRKAFLNMCL